MAYDNQVIVHRRIAYMEVLFGVLLVSVASSAQSEAEPESEIAEPESEMAEPENSTYRNHDEPAYAEPVPDWNNEIPLWGPAWDIHIYGFGVLFAVIAAYALFSILRLWKKKHLLSQPFFISLNILILILSASRSVYMLVDAYNRHHTLPHPLAYVLYSIVFPCTTSAFSLLFMALLSATQIRFMPESIQKTGVIVAVILVHFILSITTDMLLGFSIDSRIMLFICQVFYLFWGLFLFCGFLFVFKRLYKAAKIRQELMNKCTLRKFGLSGKQHSKPHKLTLGLACIVTLIASILGLCTTALHLYGMVEVYGVFNAQTPEAWKWWSFHTALRFVELGICITIIYVATQPFRYPKRTDNEKSDSCCICHCFLCAPCWSWCHKQESEYLLPDTGWSEFSADHEKDGHIKRQESQKGDYPLHHISRSSDEPISPCYIKSPMLKADHGELHFSNRDSTSITKFNITAGDSSEETNNMHNNNADQATLKIERELQQGEDSSEDGIDNSADTDALLSPSRRSGSREEIDGNNQSLDDDKISQMSPELEFSSDEEAERYTAHV